VLLLVLCVFCFVTDARAQPARRLVTPLCPLENHTHAQGKDLMMREQWNGDSNQVPHNVSRVILEHHLIRRKDQETKNARRRRSEEEGIEGEGGGGGGGGGRRRRKEEEEEEEEEAHHYMGKISVSPSPLLYSLLSFSCCSFLCPLF